MRTKLLLFFSAAIAAGFQLSTWKAAAPGYPFTFPRDHFSHPDYRTEWWYYTGNLRSGDGRHYGFELTFFRQAVDLTAREAENTAPAWLPSQLYLAHLAFTDIDGHEFFHAERLNRAGPGLAGVGDGSPGNERYWNANWQVRWNSPTGRQTLEAVTDRLALRLTFEPEKPLVIHGVNGVSPKGPLAGEASHYISYTRLHTAGRATWKDKPLSLQGLAWMDHEFFTSPRDPALAGWDWFAIQLDNREELMLYRLRNKSGESSPYSSGTFIESSGAAHPLNGADFSLTPARFWRSRLSGARYPVSWHITIPSLDLDLLEQTGVDNQELLHWNNVSPTYWEGAVSYLGRIRSHGVAGVGYLEMTGYSEPFSLGGN